MFIWTFVAHMFLPLGETGVHEIPNDQGVVSAMQTSIGDASGFYIFPGMGLGPNPSGAQKREAMKHRNDQLASSPSGIIVYHRPGTLFDFGRTLTVEFCTELAEAILAISLLVEASIVTFGHRVLFVTMIGIVAAIATNVPYWNWYGFPGNYTAAYMVIQIAGFFFVGIVAALILGKRTSTV